MLKRYAESFYQTGAVLASFRGLFEEEAAAGLVELRKTPEGAEAKQHAVRLMAAKVGELLVLQLQELDLRFSRKALIRFMESAPSATSDDIDRGVRELDRRIRDELAERVLFFVAPERAIHYDDFPRGWEAAVAKFPIATDVEEAEKCLALERYTACVFHLMRIVEIGVQELATHLKIPIAATEAWGPVLREIQKAVQAMPHATPAEKEEQSRFGNLADALFQVNLAWRIPTMHPRTPGGSYTEEQASDALGRVKAFLRILAEALP